MGYVVRPNLLIAVSLDRTGTEETSPPPITYALLLPLVRPALPGGPYFFVERTRHTAPSGRDRCTKGAPRRRRRPGPPRRMGPRARVRAEGRLPHRGNRLRAAAGDLPRRRTARDRGRLRR